MEFLFYFIVDNESSSRNSLKYSGNGQSRDHGFETINNLSYVCKFSLSIFSQSKVRSMKSELPARSTITSDCSILLSPNDVCPVRSIKSELPTTMSILLTPRVPNDVAHLFVTALFISLGSVSLP